MNKTAKTAAREDGQRAHARDTRLPDDASHLLVHHHLPEDSAGHLGLSAQDL